MKIIPFGREIVNINLLHRLVIPYETEVKENPLAAEAAKGMIGFCLMKKVKQT